MAASVALTLAAVLIAGMLASIFVSMILVLPTGIIAVMISRAASQPGTAAAAPAQYGEFPPAVREVIVETLAALPADGDARRLLLGAIVQARPILAPHAAALDEQHEKETRDNVAALVEACCATAVELSRLNSASAAAGTAAADRVAASRALLAGRLSDAASSLTSLYVAGLEHGSPASERVNELVGDITADARGRSAAASEMDALLHEGGRA